MNELLEILKELHPDVDYENCTTLIDDKILDSFDIVSIISEVSDSFDVAIPAEEIIPENFNSAKALYDLIVRLEAVSYTHLTLPSTSRRQRQMCIRDRFNSKIRG